MMQHKENSGSLYQNFVKAFKIDMCKHSNNVDTNTLTNTMLFL
jgi:hypothetical protein